MTDRQAQILEATVRVLAEDGVRGLRIGRVAAEAGVSTALIYYYFDDRAGVLRRALEHLDRRAAAHIEAAPRGGSPRVALEEMLLVELQGAVEVRRECIAWGEFRASAVFEAELRDPLRATTGEWIDHVEDVLREVADTGPGDPAPDLSGAAERLTALVEGLTARWLSGSTTVERTRELLSGAIATELGALGD
ncbi:TetR/AcrR family transcriptional regulator [Nocardia tengchongensis]|uniref:TetR/AcrR family transcriptional regulator n=1 Tax=Nocardia tengchongensis TaxID=2055889 RepID=UPI0036B73062